MIIGLQPIQSTLPTILILGSIASVTSLDKNEYYGFAHNRFWKIMQHVYHMPITTYEEKVQIILQKNIALWDVIGSCEREGSLDSAIRDVEVNDIETLLLNNPSITHILCNGKKSYTLYQKHFSHINIHCSSLPSTSNANRSISEEQLFQLWENALKLDEKI